MRRGQRLEEWVFHMEVWDSGVLSFSGRDRAKGIACIAMTSLHAFCQIFTSVRLPRISLLFQTFQTRDARGIQECLKANGAAALFHPGLREPMVRVALDDAKTSSAG